MLLSFNSEKFNGAIWRMEIDAISETVFVEVRNSEEKMVSFGSVNLSTGKLNFKNVITEERWLTGIEAAHDNVLLLHNYQSENSPVHKGLTAIDGTTGETIWSNYTFAFDHSSVNGPILYNAQIQPKKLFLADIKTGAMVRFYQPEMDKELVNNIILPQILSVSHLNKKIKIAPYGNYMHYREYNNLIIVSLHSFTAGILKQHLYIMNDAEVVYEDTLNADIQKIQPEAFIMHNNCLIYIKNKAELKVLNL